MPEAGPVPRRTSIWERLGTPDVTKVEMACELTLLFHSPSPWGSQKNLEWMNLLARIYDGRAGITYDVTTKVLCDAVRYALDA